MGLINPKVKNDFLKRSLDNWDFLKKERLDVLSQSVRDLVPRPRFGKSKDGEKVKLWFHQKVCFLLMIYLQRFMLFLDMGGGKTLLVLMVLKYMKQRGEKPRAIVFVPYVITVDTWIEEAEKWTDLKVVPLVNSGAQNLHDLHNTPDGELFVIAYQSAIAMMAKKKQVKKKNGKKGVDWTLSAATVKKHFKGFNLLAMDEVHKCFVKGTKVLTPKGEVPIESLRIGDKVVSSFGIEKVTHTFKHYTNEIVTLVLDNGKVLECTPDHPFLTNDGWVRANRITREMYVYDYEALSMVPEGVSSQRGQQTASNTKVLWNKLLGQMAHVAARYTGSGVHGRMAFQGERGTQGAASNVLREGISKTQQQAHETEQPGQGQTCCSESNGVEKAAWHRQSLVGETWRQRVRLDGGTGVHSSLLTQLATRVSSSIRKTGTRLSDLLQSGCGKPSLEISHRVRRSFSRGSKEETIRLQARYKAGRTRVVNISVKKHRRPVLVFNVEVSNTPHYFAEGILTHNCKNVNSMTYRMCRAISKEVKWAFGLTGTPFGKQLEDLWAQFFLIDFGETLGKTLGLFRSVFFAEHTNYWGGWEYKFKKKMMPILEKVIKHRSIRFMIDECHDMPKKKYIPTYVHATSDIITYYDKVVEAHNALSFGKIKYRQVESTSMKLRQLASGFMTLKGDDSSQVQVKFPNNPKLDALEAIVESMPEESKMIVFHDFRYSNGLISERLKKMKVKHARVWGGGKNNLAEIRKFKRDKNCRVLVINCQSGSSSQNLQVANYIVYFEQPRSAIDREQSERRAWRPGQKKRVFIYDLLMKDTVDEKQLNSNQEGKDLLKRVLDGSVKFRKLLH